VEIILSGLDLSFFNSNEEMVKEIATDDQIKLQWKLKSLVSSLGNILHWQSWRKKMSN
jgi:hypothetical protein